MGGNFFDQVKELVPLEQYLESLGVEIGFSGPPSLGTMTMVHCPFHQDHNRSLQLEGTARGWSQWRCFSCGEKGTVIDAVMKGEELTTPLEAVRFLDERYRLGLALGLPRELHLVEVQPQPRRRPSALAERASVGGRA